MALEELYLQENELGLVMFNKHIRTVQETKGRRRVPVANVYDCSSEKHGNFEVVVAGTDKKAFGEGTMVKLVDVYVKPKAGQINNDGYKTAYLDFGVYATEIKVAGGK